MSSKPDEERLAEFDQVFQSVVEALPGLIRKLYIGFIEAGFTSDESLAFCQSYIQSTFSRRLVQS